MISSLTDLFPVSLKQTTNLSLPPEDLDSSGDDNDAFSGSGAGELLALVLLVLDPLECGN